MKNLAKKFIKKTYLDKDQVWKFWLKKSLDKSAVAKFDEKRIIFLQRIR